MSERLKALQQNLFKYAVRDERVNIQAYVNKIDQHTHTY